MSKIVYLPLDERPCNYIYPEYIAKIGGAGLDIVPRNFMGNFKHPADVEGIWKWVREKVEKDSILILSMDLFLYGGIVPSRLHHISEEQCQQRLERLKLLKYENPELKIYAFQLITRAPARDGSGEEPDYYQDYGYRIYRYGVLRDKEGLKKITEEEKEEKQLIEHQIPGDILEDFLGRRKINFNNNKASIDLASEKIIDFLVIPLDDCREYGYAPSERRELSSYAAKKGMLSKIFFYPGADELGCTLLARAFNEQKGLKPKIYADYSSLRGKYQIPSYEDRSIGETVQYQLLAAGCDPVDAPWEADGILAVNPPTEFSLRLEKELITDEIYLESERNLPAFVNRIKKYLEKGKVCAVADCAIPNTADRALMEFLYEEDLLDKIQAYGGWNTSSNTLGTVIGHLTAFLAGGKREISQEFRFLRYLEDWGYMAEVRKKVTAMFFQADRTVYSLDLGEKGEEAGRIVKEKLEEFLKVYFPGEKRAFSVCMPWNRMFEIEIKLKKDPEI